MVARHQRRHTRSHPLDRAGALVTQHDGQLGPAHRAVHDVQTAVAHATGGEADEDFAGMELIELDGIDGQRLANAVEHRRLDGLGHARHDIQMLDNLALTRAGQGPSLAGVQSIVRRSTASQR